QQQKVRGRHKGPGQGEPHSPPTGEAAHGVHPLIGCEPQPCQKLFRSRMCGPCAGIYQGLFKFGNALAIGRVHNLPLLLQPAQLAVAVNDEFTSSPICFSYLLFDADDSPGSWNLQGTGVRVEMALQKGKKSGFARTVLTDDADTFARIHDKIGAIQQNLGAAPQYESGSAYHDSNCSLERSRICWSVAAVLSQMGSRCGKAATKFSYSWPISRTRWPPG